MNFDKLDRFTHRMDYWVVRAVALMISAEGVAAAALGKPAGKAMAAGIIICTLSWVLLKFSNFMERIIERLKELS